MIGGQYALKRYRYGDLMPDTQHELTRAQNDLAQVRAALNDRRVGLFASKRLYARLGALLREIDRLTHEMEIPEHDRQ